jgi:outer membrane protein TolC
VQADWSLGDFFKKTSLAARQDVMTQRYRMQQQQLEAMGNAAVLYIGILQTRKALQLIGIRLKLMQKHEMLAQSMWKAGLRTQLDVLQTRTQLSKLQEDSVKLTMNNENLRNTLALRLGWKSGDSLHVLPLHTKSIATIALPAHAPAEISRNLMVKMLQSKIAAQELRVKNVEANRYPHLVVGGGWFADGDPTGDGNYWLVNAGIRIPIYEGKSVKISETASLAQKESLQYQLQNVQRETVIKTKRLTEKMNKLRDMMKIQTARKQTLQQSSQFAEVNFKAGLITNMEYLDIQQKLTDAELKLEQSRLSFAMNLIDYYVVTNQVEKILEMGK